MKIDTRNFGEVEVDLGEVIHFSQPIYGFEALRDYVLLYDDSVGNCFIWLQSVDSKDVCFILLDPGALAWDYDPTLPGESAELLELTSAQEAVIRLIAVIPEDFREATVNLKSPIVINTLRHLAAQVMLEEEYPIRAPLVPGREGEPPC